MKTFHDLAQLVGRNYLMIVCVRRQEIPCSMMVFWERDSKFCIEFRVENENESLPGNTCLLYNSILNCGINSVIFLGCQMSE